MNEADLEVFNYIPEGQMTIEEYLKDLEKSSKEMRDGKEEN